MTVLDPPADAPPGTRSRITGGRTAGARVISTLPWVLLPSAASLLVLSRWRRTWFFYDEWSLIDRIVSSDNHFRSALLPFNGHLWIVNYAVYLAQVRWFGLTSHVPVYVVFAAGLAALAVATGLVLRSLGVPSLPAIVAGVAITYFGTAAQNMVFEVQIGANAALACMLFAAVVALRSHPRLPAAAAVAGLALASVASDSGVAAGGLVFLAVIVAGRWWRSPQGKVWIAAALAPPALVSALWLLHAGSSAEIDVPVGTGARIEFAIRLVLRSIGGLVGGTEIVGVVVLALCALVIVPALVTHRLPADARLGLVAGTAAAFAVTVALARTRAGIVGGDFFNFNRYLGQVAVFALIALAPAVYAAVAQRVPTHPRRVEAGATVVFALMFVCNLPTLFDYRSGFEQANVQTRERVVQALTVLERGCPPGTSPNPAAQPLGVQAPQITVRVLEQARADGLFAFDPAMDVEPGITESICTTGPPG